MRQKHAALWLGFFIALYFIASYGLYISLALAAWGAFWISYHRKRNTLRLRNYVPILLAIAVFVTWIYIRDDSNFNTNVQTAEQRKELPQEEAPEPIDEQPAQDLSNTPVSEDPVPAEEPPAASDEAVDGLEEPVGAPSEESLVVQNALKHFTKWTPYEEDAQMSLQLAGQDFTLIYGADHPNGTKVRLLSAGQSEGWAIDLYTEDSPFDEYGDLNQGLSLYAGVHDFNNDGSPEVIMAASDESIETYVWVFEYDDSYRELENGQPLTMILAAEGQSDITLDGDSIVLPYGSQGLADRYQYVEGEQFVKQ